MVESATMSGQIGALLENLKSSDNAIRTQAEAQLTQTRQSNARDLYQAFMQHISAAQAADAQTTAMACLLLKKLYLDERKSEEGLEQLTLEDIAQMKVTFKSLLNMDEPMNLLRRKAEILCKLHKREETYGELVAMLQQLALQEPNSDNPAIIQSKELAMYMFELLLEYHLP